MMLRKRAALAVLSGSCLVFALASGCSSAEAPPDGGAGTFPVGGAGGTGGTTGGMGGADGAARDVATDPLGDPSAPTDTSQPGDVSADMGALDRAVDQSGPADVSEAGNAAEAMADASDVGSDAVDASQDGDDGEAGDASDGDALPTCDDCGSARFSGACASAESACLASPGCAAIRNCVFAGGDAQVACPLNASGEACVDACSRANCTDSGSAALYRALDQCAYCTACAASCSAYCGGFADAGPATCGDQ